MKSFALVAALACGALAVQEVPEPAPLLEQHEWLEQLVGDWDASCEASMGDDTEPMTMESTEHVRSIGGRWILAEGSATFGGDQFTTLLTLGYDPRAEAFVGTWVDTIQDHMWIYRGTLDEAKRILTLETDGPSFDDPSVTAHYRDAIEIVDAYHKRLTSSVLGADGEWTTFMRSEYSRRK